MPETLLGVYLVASFIGAIIVTEDAKKRGMTAYWGIAVALLGIVGLVLYGLHYETHEPEIEYEEHPDWGK